MQKQENYKYLRKGFKMTGKVCMVVYAYYFTDARVKGYVKYLAKKGIKVDILALKEPDKKLKKEKISSNIEIYYLTDKYIGKSVLGYIWSYLKFFIFAFWKLTLLWRKNHYPIIHIHNMPNFIVFSAVIPKILGAKIILDMHDIMSLNYQSKYGNSKLGAFLGAEERLSSFFANKIICADHFQKDFLIKKRGINKNKISVIMNFPYLDIFKYNIEKRQNKSILNIVYHGTITYRLGIDLILKAIAKVKDSIPIKFYLYGTGDYMEECLKLITQEKLQDIVHTSKRFFAMENLPNLLKDKDLGIIGNRKLTISQYLLPVKMMEYMAMGIPVIAPRLSNISHYFNENMLCFYEPENVDDLADKIIYLYKNKKIRSKLVKNAYTYIQQHNWKQEFNKYMEMIYEFRK